MTRNRDESRGPRGYDAGDTKDSLFGNGTGGNVPAGLREAAGGSGGGDKSSDASGGSGDGGDGGRDRGNGDNQDQGRSASTETAPPDPESSSAATEYRPRNNKPTTIDFPYQAESKIKNGAYEEAAALQLQMLRSIPAYTQQRAALNDLVFVW